MKPKLSGSGIIRCHILHAKRNTPILLPMNIKPSAAFLICLLTMCACSNSGSSGIEPSNENELVPDDNKAAVRAVSVNGDAGSYTFSVTVASPDTGCSQYADWWEVLRADGSLLYRRILTHSHVTEQPFTRSGGPVQVADNEEIIVRAHMNNSGYGEQVFSGSIASGLSMQTIASSFMEALAFVDPIPADCAF